MTGTGPDRPVGSLVARFPTDWGRFVLTWFAIPFALIVALLLGAVMLLALGANPFTGYTRSYRERSAGATA